MTYHHTSTPPQAKLSGASMPFVGRDALLDHLRTAAHQSGELENAHAILLLAEAGVGKSRILKELRHQLLPTEVTLLHTAIYPDADTSLLSAIAGSVRTFAEDHPRLGLDFTPSLSAVSGALRRLARRGPTVLLLDDLHLLKGTALRELGQLLEAIRDEPLVIVAAARPTEFAGRGVFERIENEEVLLQGLDNKAIGLLVAGMLGEGAEESIVRSVVDSSRGNPMAVRSVVSLLLRSGTLVQREAGMWGSERSPDEVRATASRGAGMLAEGMLVHLDDDERHAAERMALLGQIFSLEAALAIVGGEERAAHATINRLRHAGILGEAQHTPIPIDDIVSQHPLLEFSHTLLHQRLVETGAKDEGRIPALVDAVALPSPLYTVLPFFQIAAQTSAVAPDARTTMRVIARCRNYAQIVLRTTSWEIGPDLGRAISTMLDAWDARLPEDAARWLRVAVYRIDARVSINKGQLLEAESAIERAFELPYSDGLLDQWTRLEALNDLLTFNRLRGDGEAFAQTAEQIEAVVACQPDLCTSHSYMMYLTQRISQAEIASDPVAMRSLAEQIEAILYAPDFEERIRRTTQVHPPVAVGQTNEGQKTATVVLRRRHTMTSQVVLPVRILLFGSVDEYRKAMEELDRLIDADSSMDAINLHRHRIHLLVSTGRMREALPLCHTIAKDLQQSGSAIHELNIRSLGLLAEASLGADIDRVTEEVEQISRIAAARSMMLPNGITWMVTHAMLSHNDVWGARITQSVPLDVLPSIGSKALFAGDAEGMRRAADAPPSYQLDPVATDPLRLLLRTYCGEATEIAERLAALNTIARSRLLTLDDAETRALALRLCASLPGGDAPYRESRRVMLRDTLAWCSERGLGSWIEGLLRAPGALLPAAERKQYRQMAQQHLAEAPQPDLRRPAETHVTLSMIGRITLQLPGTQEARPIKGANIRAFLGLMVVEHLLGQSFDRNEFRSLAAPELEDDEERGLYVRQLVYRLRETMGHNAIDTSGDHPVLNPAHVACDLIAARGALDDARALTRAGRIVPAARRLEDALKVVVDVPFPGLYGPLFESAREEIEASLRTTALRLGRRLIEEKEVDSSVSLLRAALVSTGNDPELGELLQRALMVRGEMIEAERVRMTLLSL